MTLMLLGLGTVLTFMTLIMTRRLSPLVALLTIPFVFALAGGFAPRIGGMVLDGIHTLAPIAVMLMFAIMYFGVMIEAGLFEPVISRLLRIVEGDPLKVVMGTALLALLVSLDGDGSTTYMVTVAAMLPLYRRLQLSVLNLTCVVNLASGVMNLVPWGGPTARAASALGVDPDRVFLPMLPAIAAGIACVLGLAYLLGLRERGRLGSLPLAEATTVAASEPPDPAPAGAHSLRRPQLFWFNAALTCALMLALIAGALPLSALFMIGFAAAIAVNYPKLEDQSRCIGHHAPSVIAVVSLTLAAGAFSGILGGSGMIAAIADGLLAIVPPALGPHLAVVTALASVPLTFLVSNDAFYFGVVPLIAKTAQSYGISPLEIARASLIGQPVHLLSPLVPSTYLLVGLAGVDFTDHQRFTLKWACLVSLVLMLTALACALFPVTALVR